MRIELDQMKNAPYYDRSFYQFLSDEMGRRDPELFHDLTFNRTVRVVADEQATGSVMGARWREILIMYENIYKGVAQQNRRLKAAGIDVDNIERPVSYIERQTPEWREKMYNEFGDTFYMPPETQAAESSAVKNSGRRGLRTLVALFALVALSVSVFAAYAYSNPFDPFVQDLKELFGLPRNTPISSNGSDTLYIEDGKFYDSYEILKGETGLSFLYPDSLPSEFVLNTLYINNSDDTLNFYASYQNQTIFQVFFKNAPYSKEEVENSPDIIKYEHAGKSYFITQRAEISVAVLFEGNVLYVINTKTIEQLYQFINAIK